ncbi:MAG: divergent polysaccharide deacetylase family protein, partial [Alphaproteobacteria bacterium]|nr:divergent polysaccharide deacetylase family protein [Alphaproteobacteria bacterium]
VVETEFSAETQDNAVENAATESEETKEVAVENSFEKTEEVAASKEKGMLYGPNPPTIAIVIDDMGINRKMTKEIGSLTYPLTASFLPYGINLKEQIAYSIQSGHEIMLHLPMEPQIMQNYTEDMLTTEMTDEEILQKLSQMLQKIPQAVGANNHMGSKFTENAQKMGVVMEELANKNMLFLDSKTSSKSTGLEQAKLFGTKFFARDIFIDNENSYDYIMSQLEKAEKIAHDKGCAIAIGHPKEQTYLALKDWLPELTKKGIKLVWLSQIGKD